MAYVYGSKVNSKWRAFLSYSVVTNNDTTYSIKVSAGLDTDGSGYSSSNASCTLSATGGTTYSVSGKSASGKNHVMISGKTYSWAKGTSAASKTVKAVTKTTGGTVAPGTSTATLTISVPKKTSYTVSYNANGGSGVPGAQTKWYNTTLTLSTTKPTKTGYIFSKWNTNSSGTGTSYSSGGSYTANAGATLYAIWTPNTYPVSFNANGGTSGSTTSMARTYGSSFTIPATAIPTRQNYTFLGWSTSSSATSPSYTHTEGTSGTCTISAYNTSVISPLTLYAVWELAYIAPTISNLDAYRVNSSSSSTETNEGKYIYVKFNYKGGTANNGSSWIAPNYTIKINGTTVASGTLSINSSGTGSFPSSTVAYGGSYSTNSTHTVTVTLSDSYNVSTIGQVTVTTAIYPIDLIASGNDVYMGIMRPAQNGKQLVMVPITIGNGDWPYISVNSSQIDLTASAPSNEDEHDPIIRHFDKKGTRIAQMESYRTQADVMATAIQVARNVNGTWTHNTIAMRIAADGTMSYTVGDPSAFRSAINAQEKLSTTTPSISVTTNSGTLKELGIRRYGNVVWIKFEVNNSSAVASGSNIYTGTINTTALRPAFYTTGGGYYGAHAITGGISGAGAVIIRNASSSSVTISGSNTCSVSFSYIVAS